MTFFLLVSRNWSVFHTMKHYSIWMTYQQHATTMPCCFKLYSKTLIVCLPFLFQIPFRRKFFFYPFETKWILTTFRLFFWRSSMIRNAHDKLKGHASFLCSAFSNKPTTQQHYYPNQNLFIKTFIYHILWQFLQFFSYLLCVLEQSSEKLK